MSDPSVSSQVQKETEPSLSRNKELLLVQSIFPDLSAEEQQNRQKMLEIYYRNIKKNESIEKYPEVKTFNDPNFYDNEELQSIQLEISNIFQNILPDLCLHAYLDLVECTRYFSTPMSIDDNIIKEIELSSLNNIFQWSCSEHSRFLNKVSLTLIGSTLFDISIQMNTGHKSFPTYDIKIPDRNVFELNQIENSKSYISKTTILLEEILRNLSSRSIINIIKQCVSNLYKAHSELIFELTEITLPQLYISKILNFYYNSTIKDYVRIRNMNYYLFMTYYISNTDLVLYYIIGESVSNPNPHMIKLRPVNYKVGDLVSYNDKYVSILEADQIKLEIPYISHVMSIIERHLELLEHLQDQINAIWSATNS